MSQSNLTPQRVTIEYRERDPAVVGGKSSQPAQSVAWLYFKMAESYVVAVEYLAPQAGNATAPFHMMVGHALELSLKAVSAHMGLDEEWLVMSGHNLNHCYRRALAWGSFRDASGQLESLVATLDRPHSDQRFRYPVFFRNTPSLVAEDAAQVLRPHVEDVRMWMSSTPPVERRPLR